MSRAFGISIALLLPALLPAAMVPVPKSPRSASVSPVILVRLDGLNLEADGTVVHRWYRLLRAGPGGKVAGLPRLSVRPGTDQVQVLQSRIELPGGRSTELPWQLKGQGTKHLEFLPGALPPGALLEVLVERRNRSVLGGLDLTGRHAFGAEVPVVRDVFEVQVPPGAPLHTLARGLGSLSQPQRLRRGSQEVWRWEVAAPPAGRPLAKRPNVRVTRLASWEEAAAWYRPRWRPRLEPDRAVTEVAQRLAGAEREPRAQASRLLHFVATRIRYQNQRTGGVEDLVGRSASAVLSAGQGNCADKTNLLVAMLRSLGHPASPVLASQDPGRPLDPEVPTFFPGDHALVRAQVGGAEIFMDPTRPGFALGELPRGLRRSLVWDPLAAEFMATPGGEDALRRRTTLRLQAGGAVSGEVRMRLAGEPAARLRRLLEDPKRAGLVARLLPPGLRQKPGTTPRTRAGHGSPLEVTYQVEGTLVSQSGQLSVPTFLPPAREGRRPQALLENRLEIELPPGVTVAALPAPIQCKAGRSSLDAAWGRSSRALWFRAIWKADGGPEPEVLVQARQKLAQDTVPLRSQASSSP